MRVIAYGEQAGHPSRACWDLFDVYDRTSAATSMSRTTGLTCTTFARMMLRGEIPATGVVTLEQLGADAGLVATVLAALEEKGIRYETSMS